MKSEFFRRKTPLKNNSSDVNLNPIPSSLNTALEMFQQELGSSPDVIFRNIIDPEKQFQAAIIYIDGLVDYFTINNQIIEGLQAFLTENKAGLRNQSNEQLIDQLTFRFLPVAHIIQISTCELAIKSILDGYALLLLDGCDRAIGIAAIGGAKRSIDEPSVESEIRAPREAFVEYIQVNRAMVRRKLKDPALRFLSMQKGTRTKTYISIAYLHDVVDPALVTEVKSRIDKIDLTNILESHYIEAYISDSPYSIFPQIDHTERPDRAAAMLLEGKVVIFVDGTPWALIVPTVFTQLLTTVGDYYNNYSISSVLRWLRLIAFVFTLIVPSLYIALSTMHQEMFPTPLALQIAGSRSGVPFPAIVEAFLMELSFELLREAGLRLPKAAGQAVSIVGALIIGEAAVEAGIVSPIMVIVVALTGISSFTVPSYDLSLTLRLLRFPLMVLASILGIPGITVALLCLLVYLVSLSSFGVPYLSPIAPLHKRDLKDSFIRAPWQWLSYEKHRFPQSLNQADDFELTDQGGSS